MAFFVYDTLLVEQRFLRAEKILSGQFRFVGNYFSHLYVMQIITISKGDFTITTDRERMDIPAIHDFLSNHAYWSKGIPIERVRLCIDNSLNFGIFHKQTQIGYARIISDFSTIAYLGDVYVLEDYRGQGLSKWMMEQIMAHPNLQGLRRWILGTRDAHELYKKFGFKPIARPDRYMERFDEHIYTQNM